MDVVYVEDFVIIIVQVEVVLNAISVEVAWPDELVYSPVVVVVPSKALLEKTACTALKCSNCMRKSSR